MDKYEIIEKIGTGSRAEVYLVKQRATGQLLAMKRYENKADEAERELEVLRQLKGKGVPNLYDCISFDNYICIFMEYVEGKTLREILNEKKQLSEEEAVVIAVGVVNVLKELHMQEPNYIYSDLKPENIICSHKDVIILIDFGAVVLKGEKNRGSMGTKAYRCVNDKLGPETDIYALGSILYEMLVGEVYLNAIQTDKADINHFSKSCQTVLQKAVKSNPAERYANAAMMQKDLEAWLEYTKRGSLSVRKKHNRKKDIYVIGDINRLLKHGFESMKCLAFSGILIILFISMFQLRRNYSETNNNVLTDKKEKVETIVVMQEEIGSTHTIDKKNISQKYVQKILIKDSINAEHGKK